MESLVPGLCGIRLEGPPPIHDVFVEISGSPTRSVGDLAV